MSDQTVKGLLSESEPGRKGEILDAAFDVFAEKGYDAGSMRDIATRVGVSEPALYRHFPGKEALFIAIMRVGAGRLRNEALAMLAAIDPHAPLRQQMRSALSNRRRAMRFYGPLVQTLLPAAVRDPRFMDEWRSTVITPVRAGLTEKAAEIDAALGMPDNADTTREQRLRALLSLIVGYIATSFVLGDEADEAIVDATLRVMGWHEPS